MNIFRFAPLLSPEDGGGAGAGAGGAGGGQGAGGGAGAGAGAGAGGGQQQQTTWYESLGLDNDTRDFVAGKQFPDLKTALSAGRQADIAARSRNVMDAPDPQKMAEWPGWQKLGWTEKREDYQVERPQLRDDLKPLYSEQMEKAFLDKMHELRVPKQQAKGALDVMVQMLAAEHDAKAAAGSRASQELETKLRTDWGRDYDVNKDLSTRAARALGIGAKDASELERVIGGPRMLNLFAKIGKMMGEDTLKGGAAGGGSGTQRMSPEAAAVEQRRLEADPEFIKALQDPRHPRHADVTAQRNELIRIKTEGQQRR